MERKRIGFIRITLPDGKQWFGDILEGDNIDDEVKAAYAHFGNDAEIYIQEYPKPEQHISLLYDPYGDIYHDNYDEVRL